MTEVTPEMTASTPHDAGPPWDPDVAVIVDRMIAAGSPASWQRGVEKTREMLESIVRPSGPDMASVEDATADGPHGPIPLRIYRPHIAPAVGAPALVWYHGGGMIMGSLDSFDRLARDVAHATGAVLINVDYRLAPEHRYPAGNDDAYAALEWAHRRAGDLGLDASRIGVGGDSAGGGLAASTALRSRNTGGPRITQQVMFYPGVARRDDTASMRDFGDSVFLTAEDIDWMKNMYLGEDPSQDDEYGTPAIAASLAGLPPAIIAVGQGDPIRDSVEQYGDRLRDAGVQVAQLRYPGVGHGFAMQTASIARARLAMAEVGALVAARFASRTS